MRILFVMDKRADAGSIQAIANYVRAGDEMGHDIALYGRSDPTFPTVRFSTDPNSFDYVMFVIESGLDWMSGLRMPRLLSNVPRRKRVIFDADGMYNQRIIVDSYDRNHITECMRLRWLAHCENLADLIFQPTLCPREPGVKSLLFYGYDPESQVTEGEAPPKRFDVLHLGHNWWRWREVSNTLLPAIERIRQSLGEICFVGAWWNQPPSVVEAGLEPAFYADTEWFQRLGIQVWGAVPFTNVISIMSTARVNIMTQRPLFRRLRMLTSKFFEIFTADTIAFVMLDPEHAESVYGPAGKELALYDGIENKLLDALHRPLKYRKIMEEVRRHLSIHHSYRKRLQELIAALDS
jgi:hypothetical protein